MRESSGTFIHQIELGSWRNFIYFIGDRASRQCAVVDPAWDVPAILREAERLEVRISHILLTHSHMDHVNGVDELRAQVDCPVHMMAEEIDHAGFTAEGLIRRRPGDVISVGKGTEITLLHTPGHTPGSTTYQVGDRIVTGDTLFVNGCGRCDFVGGDPQVMHRTLRTLTSSLPGDTVMYPGHNYGQTPTSTLDEQLRTNPFLVLPTLRDFLLHRMKGVEGWTLPEGLEGA